MTGIDERQTQVVFGPGGHQETLSSRAEVPVIIDGIAATMAYHLYVDKDIFAVRIALEEAMVNAIRHGNRDDSTRCVRVSFLVGPEYVLVEVKDEGTGFDPKSVPDPLASENLDRPSGRGLFLMRRYMTWVRFNARGNWVTMCKWRSNRSRDE